MTTGVLERPDFFEGQYLGAEDLDVLVDYVRAQDARQSLGHHTWGIVVGLELTSEDVGDGSVEYAIQPGLAFDGYGRAIVVASPTVLPTEKFVSIASGEVPVWIRYDEAESGGVRKGFEVCSASDAFSRRLEGFEVEVGSRSRVEERESGVRIGGAEAPDARRSLIETGASQSLVCDGSIPHQDLPVSEVDNRWLVPLGLVVWNAASSSFAALNEEQTVRDRVLRRHVGLVGEDVLAPGGLVRLRDRLAPLASDAESDCGAEDPTSLDWFVCDGTLRARETIWLEADSRVTGDLRLFGTRLEFRDAAGGDYVERTVDGVTHAAIEPLALERTVNEKGGNDLQALIGTSADSDKPNRFVVAAANVTGTSLCDVAIAGEPRVVVQDDGRMGIGTAAAPDSTLTAPLTVRGLAGEIVSGADAIPIGRLLDFEDPGGAVQWQLDLWDGETSLALSETGADPGAIFLQAGGNVGLGTVAPEANLDVSTGAPTSGGSPLGEDLWLRLGDGGDDGRVWVEYGAQAAPLLVLSDRDDPPRIQFQQTDSTDPGADASPVHASWFGHARGSSPDLAIVGGLLGIGTDQPYAELTLEGTIGFRNGTTPLIYLFESGTNNLDRMVVSHSPAFPDVGVRYEDVTDTLVVDTPGGLQVLGDVRLGATGSLFAAGGEEALRLLAGRVSGTSVRGAGFSVSHPDTGRYVINFDTAFADLPFVVATVEGDIDNLATVHSVGLTSCEVRIRDVEGSNADDDDANFMLIIVGAR